MDTTADMLAITPEIWVNRMASNIKTACPTRTLADCQEEARGHLSLLLWSALPIAPVEAGR
jgi:hypothetical protein